MKTGKKTKEQVNQELQEKFPNLEIVGDYLGANEKTRIKCNNCGHEWLAIPRSVRISKYGCTKCGHLKVNYEKALNYFLNKYDSDKYELLEFDGKDSWRNERNRDLEGVLKQKSIDELREIGCSMLQRFLSQA